MRLFTRTNQVDMGSHPPANASLAEDNAVLRAQLAKVEADLRVLQDAPAAARSHLPGIENETAEVARREFEDEQQARAAADAAAMAWAFLAEASQSLSRSLNFEMTLQAMTRVVVPYLADFSLVYAMEANQVCGLAATHRELGKTALVKEFARWFQPQGEKPDHPAIRVLQSGRSQLFAAEALPLAGLPAEVQRAAQALAPHSLLLVPLSVRGDPTGMLILGSDKASRRYSPAEITLAEELARRAALAVENARLYQAERRSHAAAEAARDQAAFLATISAILASSLDYENTLNAAAQFVVPGLAQWCLVDLLIGGKIECKALAAETPDTRAILRKLRAAYPPALNGPGLVAEALHTGESILVSDLPASFLELTAQQDEQHLNLLRRLGCRSCIVTPIRARGQTLGAFTVASAQANRYTPDDLRLVEEIAWRVATALDNGRLYRAEQEARAAAAEAARASAFLAEASRALSRLLNYEATLQALARLVLPYLGELSIVYGYNVYQVSVASHCTATAHEPFLPQLAQLYHPEAGTLPNPAAHTLQSGESLLVADDFESYFAAAPGEARQLAQQLGLRGMIVAPLRVRERVVGALVLLAARPERRYRPSDLVLAEEVARRAALAAENARLYAEAQAWNSALEMRVRERTEALRQSHEQLQQLAIHHERLREEERARIAREVHDELGGALTILKLGLVRLRKELADAGPEKVASDSLEARPSASLRINSPGIPNRALKGASLKDAAGERVRTLSEPNGQIDELAAMIDATVQTVRRIASDLRPAVLDDLGLIPALEWQAQEFQKRTGIPCRFSSFTDELELDRESSTAIFRVFQESLTNIARHAQATEVTAALERNERYLALQVRDNGRGINMNELNNLKSLGLIGMRERMRQVAGALDIQGAPGQGTTVLIRLPWADSVSSASAPED